MEAALQSRVNVPVGLPLQPVQEEAALYEPRTVLVIGKPSNIGTVLVRKLLKAGYKVKAPAALIYRDDTFLGADDMNTIGNLNLIEIEDRFGSTADIKEIVSGSKVVVYVNQVPSADELDRRVCASVTEALMACGVERLVFVSDNSKDSALFSEHLKNNMNSNFSVMVINTSQMYGDGRKRKIEIPLDIFTQRMNTKHKVILFGGKLIKTTGASCSEDLSDRWYLKPHSAASNFYNDNIADLGLHLLQQPLEKIHKKSWAYSTTCRIFLSRFFIVQKLLKILKAPYAPILGRIKFFFNTVKRLFDVLMMMLLVHARPEQVFRFSTRKCLPHRGIRFSKNDRPAIPFELIESRTSDIPKMREANIVLRGSSFDIKKLEKLNGPIFLASFWEPVQTKKDVTYITGGAKNAVRLAKLGCKVVYFEVNTIDRDGRVSPNDEGQDSLWYKQFIDGGLCQRIAIFEKVFRSPQSLFPFWTPTGSALPAICALSYFAETLNVYGWDFYLNSSPDTMNYWQLYSNLYKLKFDVLRSRNHFESAIINFYYGYHLSKLPNINIYGYLGQLSKHEKLIGKLERVLFNPDKKEFKQ